MKLVTVICEALAKEPLLRALEEAGAHGHTLFAVEGSGAQGLRAGEMSEFANIQVEVIVPPAVAVMLLERLQQEFFPRFAMVAYEMDIRVLRPNKF
jgi:nitrogen regulatory protein PII